LKSIGNHIRSDFIIDIGMCDGADTAFYLHKGYKVLAIDADPELCAAARLRFEQEISKMGLVVLNVGVSSSDQDLTFYRCKSHPADSTFDPSLRKAERPYEQLVIPCRPLSSILQEYGVPYYLKIDIEGYDAIALESLAPETAPPYISVEITHSPTVLLKLQELGYRSFKLINQTYHTTHVPIGNNEIGWRLLRKGSRKIPALHGLIRRLPEFWRPRTEWDSRFSPDGWAPAGRTSSGPFAEETHGRWQDFAATMRTFQAVTATHDFVWWDVHARLW
jgi:FkbM family methyltransferase